MTHSLDVPPLDSVNALLAAGELGSFTAAAEALGVTHGSISRRIGQLEAWAGVTFFERHGRGVRLTPAGLRFAREARAALEGLASTAQQWRPRKGRQTVRVSAVPSFARLWLLPRLARLEAEAGIHVELVLSHSPATLGGGRDADLAVRYGRGDWPDLRAALLMRETLSPGGSPRLVAGLPRNPDPEDLLARPLLHDSDISQWRTWFAARGVTYRPRPQDRKFEDYDTVLAAAEAGLGLAMLRAPLATPWVRAGRLTALESAAMVNPARHWLVTDRDEGRERVIEAAARLAAMGAETV
jgi:LysR family glycine cleavage system transcriptional activator